ncbi:MAG: DegV family EDD domain-containing protein [Clostridiales bacterium]|nr:DegV family EDD domain-containing protein [Clostridiales bacterium]
MFSKMREYLLNDSIDFRKRMFTCCVLFTVIILLITTVEVAFTDTYAYAVYILFAYIVVFIAISVIAIKVDKINLGAIVILIAMGMVHFPVLFFTEGGINGDAPVWFVYDMFLISVMLQGKVRVVFYVIQDLIFTACYVIAYLYPDLIFHKMALMSYVYSLTVVALVCTAIATIIILESRLYKRRNEIAEQQRKEIEGLVASQNRFFSSMSHEIRTPINTIIGLNEMILREEGISDEVAEDAVNIRVSGKLLLNLINDILDMSKFQAGDMHLLIEPYSTGNMLSELVGMLWIRAKDKGLDFHINVAPDIPAELMGDEVRIKQILMNILNNAIKYTKQGSITLTVECEHIEGSQYNIIYSVSDTGMGIKKEDIPYLFTAFKRVDESNTRHIEGTGLGLSIVKQFLDLMDGKVTVNSVYTKGSTFIIEIPQKAATDRQIGEYDYAKRHALSKRTVYKQKFEAPDARILAVDDNQSNLLVVTKLLRDTKVQIDTVLSGPEALKKTLDNDYDVIFMDHLMPEMDGIDCVRAIRSQTGGKCRETAIVILTANADEENRALYAVEGFAGYLVKPVSGDELENELIRLLPKDKVKMSSDAGEIAEESISWMSQGKQKKRVAITTESVADLPYEFISRYDIGVVPHKVVTDEGTFKDGIEIDTYGVLAYMEDESHTMMPQSPNVAEMEAFFAEQLQDANNIVHIAISSDIENTGYPAAVEAARSFDNVFVVDSKQLSSGQGLVALVACYLADAGKNPGEIIDTLNYFRWRVHSSFMVDSLDYLARAKQISAGAANLTKSFMARPVLAMSDGKIKMDKINFGSTRRTWKKYINSCLSISNIDTHILFVTYVGINKKDLDWIRDIIEECMHFEQIYFVQASPAIAVNCGPGTFGLLLMEKMVEE